ncbi:hypothetical protein M440DRAFT_109129 [Trichoderma longibrachiatum ATCC 18648]|uniref:Uncharacterized protein n=1 Tax=Trichoderma longibrachiatum ATCC 18648 TaxID=983965 RepID=A0A2T4BXU8_TRILO|nr:hypothetical protein M440DRAFT_109129 [Trichoderma longibrachiatum ATCC 18648]
MQRSVARLLAGRQRCRPYSGSLALSLWPEAVQAGRICGMVTQARRHHACAESLLRPPHACASLCYPRFTAADATSARAADQTNRLATGGRGSSEAAGQLVDPDRRSAEWRSISQQARGPCRAATRIASVHTKHWWRRMAKQMRQSVLIVLR